MATEITFLKRKYDGSTRRQRTGALVEVRGDWLVVLYSPAVHTHRKHGQLVTTDTGNHLFYLNTRLPLVAMNYFEAAAFTGSYVDAALPTTFDGAVASYVDLELDIVAERGEAPYVKDILDFELARARFAYPPDVIDAAWRGIRVGAELLSNGAFPFDGSAERMLQEALADIGGLP